MRCRKLASQLATDLYRTWAKDNPQEAREAADGVTSEVSTSLVGEPPGSPRLSCSVFLSEWFVPSNVCWENEREHEPRQHAGLLPAGNRFPCRQLARSSLLQCRSTRTLCSCTRTRCRTLCSCASTPAVSPSWSLIAGRGHSSSALSIDQQIWACTD